ncbi:hypothetical protein GGR54DRAFT_32143 [Hypoxylon sp. NC1633]|nr:hypothetical protein GGR54DRAFT_32143 [Hypoxylon sp. NC1633]
MQFTMGRSANSHQVSGPARQAAVKPDSYRQGHAKQHRQAKSQPFDADDLRRRLYVVIAEQDASKEKRRRERLEEARSKQNGEQGTPIIQLGIEATNMAIFNPAHTKPEAVEPSFSARMVRSKYTEADSLQRGASTKPSDPKLGRSMSKSIQDKLRRKPSRAGPVPTETESKPLSYHHVPQEAASQFERTATANGMRDNQLVHSLSQSALRFHVEGRPSDQIELDSSVTPAQQNRALKRAQSHREKLHERNQFQATRLVSDERRSSEESRHRRRSSAGKPGKNAGFGYILEDEALTIPVHPATIPNLPIDEVSSEETLVVDPAAANEHRVDWTQSDEVYHEKPKALTGARIPLLRKADSLWTLKGKKSSGERRTRNGYVRDGKMSPLREKQEDAPTSPSPPKFLRLGFLTRFRR